MCSSRVVTLASIALALSACADEPAQSRGSPLEPQTDARTQAVGVSKDQIALYTFILADARARVHTVAQNDDVGVALERVYAAVSENDRAAVILAIGRARTALESARAASDVAGVETAATGLALDQIEMAFKPAIGVKSND